MGKGGGEREGVVGVSGGKRPASLSLTSPSANCRKAEPTPLRDITNWACDKAKACRAITACFIRRFLALHLATPSSFSIFEFVHPILNSD